MYKVLREHNKWILLCSLVINNAHEWSCPQVFILIIVTIFIWFTVQYILYSVLNMKLYS